MINGIVIAITFGDPRVLDGSNYFLYLQARRKELKMPNQVLFNE